VIAISPLNLSYPPITLQYRQQVVFFRLEKNGACTFSLKTRHTPLITRRFPQLTWFVQRIGIRPKLHTHWGHHLQDAWDGYRASRTRVLDFIERSQIDNVVVLSGDSHANWVSDLARKYCTGY
jgi:phosphodiesterase/alkaline phosphatase D-like protein